MDEIPVYGLRLQEPRPATTNVACPKCHAQNLVLEEVWRNTICFQVTDGVLDRANGSLETGDPSKVQAKCQDCGHLWTIRGATSIDSVTKLVGSTD